jgi:hypothetical protein
MEIPKLWIEAEVIHMARLIIRANMLKAGIKASHVKPADINKAVYTLLEHDPELRKLAKRRVSSAFAYIPKEFHDVA